MVEISRKHRAMIARLTPHMRLGRGAATYWIPIEVPDPTKCPVCGGRIPRDFVVDENEEEGWVELSCTRCPVNIRGPNPWEARIAPCSCDGVGCKCKRPGWVHIADWGMTTGMCLECAEGITWYEDQELALCGRRTKGGTWDPIHRVPLLVGTREVVSERARIEVVSSLTMTTFRHETEYSNARACTGICVEKTHRIEVRTKDGERMALAKFEETRDV